MSKVTDLEKPLFKITLFDLCITSFTKIINHLFICQYCCAGRAPVYSGFLLICQVALKQFKEYPLRPFIIFRFTGRNFSIPIVTNTPSFKLRLHLFDVVYCMNGWVDTVGNRSVFSRQAKGIPTNWREYPETFHNFVAGDDITYNVIPSVSNVKCSRGVREHDETVKLVFVALFIYPEQPASFPEILPLFLYFTKVILFITHYINIFQSKDYSLPAGWECHPERSRRI